MEETMNPSLICETRDAKIVSPVTDEIVYRTARYLRPFAENGHNQAADIPHVPLLSEAFPHDLQQWRTKVLFKGWKCPQKDWERWVQALAVKYKRIWERSGIYDAVLCSKYEFRSSNPDVVLGLVEFWCPKTSTFLFPWGEATVTLEDVMVLGGYPVSGKSVRRSPPLSLSKIVDAMDIQRRELSRLTKARKASHGEWLKRYMQAAGNDREVEHVAFLSLWLSRYVFPQLSPAEIVGKYVFPIAVQLSRGIPMALGPAVLASLYRDLTFLKKEAASDSREIAVAAPFQLLQLWAFERFPALLPKDQKMPWFSGCEPRAARWSKINSRVNLQLVKSTVKLKENFVWQPYIHDNPRVNSLDRRYLEATELVGLDCKETYKPQRVAMQFGFDQDIPGRIRHYRYDSHEQSEITIHGRSIAPGVSTRYLRWWKDSMSARERAVREIVSRNRSRTTSSGNAISRGPGNRWTARKFKQKFYRTIVSTPPFHRKDHYNDRRTSAESNPKRDRKEDEIDLIPISKLLRTKNCTASAEINQKSPSKPNHVSKTEKHININVNDELDHVSLSKRIKMSNTCNIIGETKEELTVKVTEVPAEGSAGAVGAATADKDEFNMLGLEERLRNLENLVNLKSCM